MVTLFTTKPDKAFVFIGGYNVGSVGLNLQALCNHEIAFDSAPNKGTQDQATGRLRRLNQPYTVERFELSVERSFQSRIIQNSLKKAIPGAMAELSINIESNKSEEGDIEYSVGDWYLVDNELIQAPDPRVANIPAHMKLSPKALVETILDLQRGTREEVEEEDEGVWGQEEFSGFDELNE